MEQIIIKNLWKSYDSLTVLKNVDLTLDRDQTYCLMSFRNRKDHFIPHSYGVRKGRRGRNCLECQFWFLFWL